MINYTKGEWILNKEPYLGKDTYILWVAGEGQIAKITTNKANAQLIASAPDLYEALKNLRHIYTDYLKGSRELDFWVKVDKALAKAEGK